MGISVTLLQDGARGHYGLAVALERAGILERVYTDFYASPRSIQRWLAEIGHIAGLGAGRKMLERHSSALDAGFVCQSLLLALKLRLRERQFDRRVEFYKWASKETAKWIMRKEKSYKGVMLGFVRNIHPDLCKRCNEHGMPVICDQMIAPAATEAHENRIQQAMWPGWERRTQDDLDDFDLVDSFERETWAEAAHLIAPSEYVRHELVRQGVSREKVTVINYAIDDLTFRPHDRSTESKEKIIIGFMGTLCLRKGIQFFNEMAKRLKRNPKVEFVAVGAVEISENALRQVGNNVRIVGKVPRSEASNWLQSFDILYFPTTCEGSAYVLMEAMATGLPIVTTPNSGTVARHGHDGFIAPYEALDEHEHLLERLILDRDLRLTMGASAAKHYARFNLDAYSARVLSVVNRVTCPQSNSRVS